MVLFDKESLISDEHNVTEFSFKEYVLSSVIFSENLVHDCSLAHNPETAYSMANFLLTLMTMNAEIDFVMS